MSGGGERGAINPLVWNPKQLAASGIVKTGPGRLRRVICSTSTALVANLYDGVDNTGTKVLDSMPFAAKDNLDIPMAFVVGLYYEIASGSGKVTFLFI